MHRQPFVIELMEDVVISQRAATLGGHGSLDYLPGQALLGACAARLYRTLGQHAYAVFHSGMVRFGNAYCLGADDAPAWPVPLCWHQAKTEAAADRSRLDDGSVYNFQHGNPRDLLGGAQPKQLRDGYVSDDGALHKPRRVMRMKTAIEPGTGRAGHAQLFGYQALIRGTRLGGWIEADAALEEGLFQQIVAALTGPLLLGRSRSAEYGQARFAPAAPDFEPPEPGAGSGTDLCQSLTLWLLSDLALMDDQGQPTLEPAPEHVGLVAGDVDWSRTFLRTRRYAPWNGKRGAPDLERWVIQQGSVVRLNLAAPLDRIDLLALCSSGLGLYRECGLGRVWVDPPLLETVQPEFAPAEQRRDDGADGVPDQSKDPLILWLKEQVGGGTDRERVERLARDLATAFAAKVSSARRERGISDKEVFGPSRSQWGRVLETARVKPASELLAALFVGDDAVIKPTAEGWREVFFGQSRSLSLAAWIESRLRVLETDRARDQARPDSADAIDAQLKSVELKHLPRLVQRLAHHCRNDMEQRAQ
jgi:CRISPR-associated protein Csx10